MIYVIKYAGLPMLINKTLASSLKAVCSHWTCANKFLTNNKKRSSKSGKQHTLMQLCPPCGVPTAGEEAMVNCVNCERGSACIYVCVCVYTTVTRTFGHLLKKVFRNLKKLIHTL